MSGPAPTMWISWKSGQNCDQYRNFLYVYKYTNIADLLIRDIQNEKRDQPPLAPFEVEDVRIVVIFRSEISLICEPWVYIRLKIKGNN